MTTVFRPNRFYRRTATGKLCTLCPLRLHAADVVGLRDELTGHVDFAHLACVGLVLEAQAVADPVDCSGCTGDPAEHPTVDPAHVSSDPSLD